ncbi:MAG TPA: hypothetical protein VMK12_00250 [Anaeromyxobacteraceae bacterium]|nr:hypothetical protein [Anaeromyxobacteraceae bacterium]
MSHQPLFTWRDVERALSLIPDAPWLRASADAVGVVISCLPERKAQVLDTLRNEFGPSTGPDGSFLRLEAAPGASRELRVYIETAEEEEPKRQRVLRPLWADSDRDLPVPTAGVASLSVPVLAYYSYKGGVGRTTALIATLGAVLRAQPTLRVLVVDADLEAPGLTWNLPSRSNRLSFFDVLALVHDADDWRREAMPVIVDRVSTNVEQLELPEGRASFYFVPAFRDQEQLFSPRISVEQVVRARDRSNVVPEVLSALAEQLKAVAVLIDLRAGVTELSSPLVLDPRVQPILVSSMSRQSIEGTALVLERLQRRAYDPQTAPEVVLSMIPPETSRRSVESATANFLNAMPLPSGDTVEAAAHMSFHEVTFAQELLAFEGVEKMIADAIPGTDLGKKVAPELASLVLMALQPASEPAPQPERQRGGDLKDVISAATRLEYAEGNSKRGLLSTPAITALAEQFHATLPAVVVLGAKGSGKTFAWGQTVLARDWKTFVENVVEQPAGSQIRANARIFPLLGPSNPSAELSEQVRAAETEARTALKSDHQTTDMESVRATLAGDRGDGREEVQFWTHLIAERLGLPAPADLSIVALADEIGSRQAAIVLVTDGLEDAFQVSPENPLSESKRQRLRALLQSLTLQIRDLRSPHLGIATFIRRDIAESAIQQNFGQFEALYRSFALTWSPLEALRLVAWLLHQAGRDVIKLERIPFASYDELRDKLQTFWGERLGSPKSREAFTDRWVIAALCDFQGRLQARDVVRLIRVAAEKVEEGNRLTPRALRDALPVCSKEKVKELEEEIHALRPLFQRLRSAVPEKKVIPFRAGDFKLSAADLELLKTHGILTEVEKGELYIPEIVRHGLGFRLEGGRRAKVLALYKAAQQRANAR